MSGSDIVVSQPQTALPSRPEWDGILEIAERLGSSGVFKDTATLNQTVAKIVFGRDLGLGASQALTGIHMVEGKPELSANLQAALLRQYRSPEGARYDYLAKVSSEGCSITVERIHSDGTVQVVGETEFTIADAQRAGLTSRNGPWKTYPQNMCFARALSNAVAFFAPEVAYGTRVYTQGEISEADDFRPAPIPAGVQTEADVRPCRDALRRAVRSRGASAPQAVALVTEALDSLGVPTAEDLDARLRACDDQTVIDAASLIENPVQDAVVVEADEITTVTAHELFDGATPAPKEA